ncbi:hypothetical protein HU675_0040180 [Bradyrhizobium septentrionale]|nr:hypothetical protein [Bradyrhizobium septentrionale]UGY24095.1 hypothetical protein HU675_0040180 [Bradyrhizobium septentrionale]
MLNPPTTWLKPLRSIVVPAPAVTADTELKASAAPARSVPPLTVVAPL